MAKRKTLEQIRATFKQYDEVSKIKDDLDVFDDDISNHPFNPDTASLSKVHDIMDSVQIVQTKLARLKKRALRQETICKLYSYDVKLAYDEKYDIYLNDLAKTKVEGEKTLKANMEASARKKLRDDGIETYKIEADKKDIRIKGYLKEIDAYMQVMKEIDEKCSRKISLMSLQNDLGVLCDAGKKHKRDDDSK
jgi:hypothetical protein